jgi:NAD(P)-dependent dehydrogenase (short-subunit alcohol dehydrogenase family)
MIQNESIPPEMVEDFINTVPLKRPARPEEVAQLIVFLLEETSSYMTGQTIPIEGGITI